MLRVGICSRLRTFREDGFSLLELLLVIFIISLTVAFVFPYISSDKQSKNDIKTVSSILKFAYETSLATKSPCTLKIDLKDKLVSYECRNQKGEYKIDSLFAVQTSSRGVIKEGSVIITYELGKEESITVHLYGDNRITKINISSLSGRVKILDS